MRHEGVEPWKSQPAQRAKRASRNVFLRFNLPDGAFFGEHGRERQVLYPVDES